MDKNNQPEPIITVREAKKMSFLGKLGIVFCIVVGLFIVLLVWGNWSYRSEKAALQTDIYKACYVQANNSGNEKTSTELWRDICRRNKICYILDNDPKRNEVSAASLWKGTCDMLQYRHSQEYGERYYYEIYLDKGNP